MATSADSQHERWDSPGRGPAYTELEHPADIFVEVYGRDLPELFENALFALYDELAQLDGFEVTGKRTISARGPGVAEALRALLTEALYLFSSQHFVAATGKVRVETEPGGEVHASADLGGETVRGECHVLCLEVKGVTYHQLSVEQQRDGSWKATVLFDV